MANEGNLMLELKPFKKDLFERILKEKPGLKKTDVEYLFTKMQKEIGFIHITTRKFGDSKEMKYVSLLLKSISVES